MQYVGCDCCKLRGNIIKPVATYTVELLHYSTGEFTELSTTPLIIELCGECYMETCDNFKKTNFQQNIRCHTHKVTFYEIFIHSICFEKKIRRYFLRLDCNPLPYRSPGIKKTENIFFHFETNEERPLKKIKFNQ